MRASAGPSTLLTAPIIFYLPDSESRLVRAGPSTAVQMASMLATSGVPARLLLLAHALLTAAGDAAAATLAIFIAVRGVVKAINTVRLAFFAATIAAHDTVATGIVAEVGAYVFPTAASQMLRTATPSLDQSCSEGRGARGRSVRGRDEKGSPVGLVCSLLSRSSTAGARLLVCSVGLASDHVQSFPLLRVSMGRR